MAGGKKNKGRGWSDDNHEEEMGCKQKLIMWEKDGIEQGEENQAASLVHSHTNWSLKLRVCFWMCALVFLPSSFCPLMDSKSLCSYTTSFSVQWCSHSCIHTNGTLLCCKQSRLLFSSLCVFPLFVCLLPRASTLCISVWCLIAIARSQILAGHWLNCFLGRQPSLPWLVDDPNTVWQLVSAIWLVN